MNPGELIHLYIDGAFDRRELVRRLAKLVGGTQAAIGLIAAEGLMAQECQTCPDDVRVPPDAADLTMQSIQYDGQASPLFGYLATRITDSTDPIPGVVVIHENRGLTGYVKDVTRRLARAGYMALGIDLLSRLGGTDQYANDPTAAVSAYNSLSADARLQDMLSSLAYLKSLPMTSGKKIGCIGFCAGGGNSFQLAVNGGKDVSAAVVFYGTPPTQAQVADQLSAPVLCLFGEQDRNFTGQLPGFITNALNARKSFEAHVYQGANHAFHNDTGAAYNRDAACDAWAKTLAWYGKYLA